MALKKENSNADRGNQPSENMPLGEEIIGESRPVSKDGIPTQKPLEIKINKTVWDRIGQGLQVLSSLSMVVATIALVVIAYKQWGVAEKQATAAEKQAALAAEQIKIAKAQNEFMRRINEEAKRANLNIKQVVDAYYNFGESDDGKGKIDLVFRNVSSRPTAILVINLRSKEGSYFRTIGESDGIKLPLNIGAWSAEKVSFSLKKDDIKQMKDIVVTDLDDRQTPIKEKRWNVYVKSNISLVATLQAKVSSTSGPVKVCNNQTETYSDITIFVESIKFEKQSGRLVVDVIISAPGKKDKHFSSDKVDTCWTYDEYAVRLRSVSADCAEFIISYNGKPCE